MEKELPHTDMAMAEGRRAGAPVSNQQEHGASSSAVLLQSCTAAALGNPCLTTPSFNAVFFRDLISYPVFLGTSRLSLLLFTLPRGEANRGAISRST